MRVFRSYRRALVFPLVLGVAIAALATPAVASEALPRIAGAIESGSVSNSTHLITISGWAEDMDQRAVSPVISVWIDDRYVRAVTTTISRPDVNAKRGMTGNHGFRVSFGWGVAAKSVAIRVHDGARKLTLIGSRTLTQIAPPLAPAGTRIITEAKKYVGLHNPGYVDGGTSPVTGFDCSGYTQYVYRVTHVATLPRTAEQQRRAVRLIPGSQARPGDLVFYLSGASAYHIAIYAGNGMQYSAATPQDGIRYQGVWSSAVQYGTTWH
ncbi:MAG: NlpC/P60 family protein [Pseudonocardiales bacterium]|nr:NlpC/P60 family protein [Actinomycetota bacterium]